MKREILSGEEASHSLSDNLLREGMYRLAASNMGIPVDDPDADTILVNADEFRSACEQTLQHGKDLRREGRFSVVVDNNEIAAMGAYYPIGKTEDERNVYFITRLVTLERHVGKGAAQSVLNAIESKIQQEDPGAVTVVCTRIPAVKHLCTTRGYSPISIREYSSLLKRAGKLLSEESILEQENDTTWTYYIRDAKNLQ